MNKKRTYKKQGFTLVELLTVIAIIGILAAILIPTVGNVMRNARKTAAQSNGRQVGLSYGMYAMEGSRVKTIRSGAWSKDKPFQANNANQWAAVVATYAKMNDANFYFISDDPEFPSDSDITTVLDDSGNLNGGSSGFPTDGIAWTLVGNMPRNRPTATTPLLWTRGFKGSKWEEDAPWGEDGGHIIFLDGHTTWQKFTNEINVDGDLISNVDGKVGKATENIFEAAIGTSSSSAPSASKPGVFNP